MKLPVLFHHDHQRVIGFITLDEKQIPKNPNFFFAMGYRILERNEGGEVTKFEPLEISLVLDENKS